MPGLGTPALAALRRWRRGVAASPLRRRHALRAGAACCRSNEFAARPELFFSARAHARGDRCSQYGGVVKRVLLRRKYAVMKEGGPRPPPMNRRRADEVK